MNYFILFLFFLSFSDSYSQKNLTNLYLTQKEKPGVIKQETLVKVDTVTLSNKKVFILNKFELVLPLFSESKPETYYLITIEPKEHPTLEGTLDLDEARALVEFAASNLENTKSSITFSARYRGSLTLDIYKSRFIVSFGNWSFNNGDRYAIYKKEFLELANYLKEYIN